jgi:hypothetical protein
VTAKTSAELLEEQTKARHAATRAHLATVSVPDADLVRLTQEATAHVRGDGSSSSPKPLAPGAKLTRAERIAAADPDRMVNISVCEADLPKFQGRPFNREQWMRDVERELQHIDFGRVHHSTVILACEKLAAAAAGGNGMARWSYDLWSFFTHCCRSTLHKIIHALWAADLVQIVNTFYWLGKDQRRGANAYFPRNRPAEPEQAPSDAQPPAASADATLDADLVEAAPADVPSRTIARMGAALRELAPYFPGLVARVFGLNTSPSKRRPAPA